MRSFIIIFLLATCYTVTGQSLSFVPDYTFKGTTLTGWKPAGNWKVQNGEIVNTGGGLLMYERSFQDIAVNTQIKISGNAEAGILFRADGMRGIMIVLRNDSSYACTVQIDAQGKILHKEKLRPAGGMVRMVPPPDPNAPARSGGYGQRSTANLPLARPNTAWKPNEWNQMECIMDMNLLRGYINDGNGPGGAADSIEFGPIALYASGTGEVRFKEFKYKDLAIRYTPKEATAARFQVQQISDMYYAWSAAAADFNNDKITDIVAGPYIYYGPDYTHFREIYPAFAFNPSKEFTEVNCQYAYDFNKDGWTDIFVGPPFGRLYINPKGESRRWDVYSVIPGNINSEVTVFTDIDGDQQPDLVYGGNGVLKYARFNTNDPTQPWKVHTISEPGYFTAHGIGAGDINGDGRIDIINPYGWWEQPATTGDQPWTFHAGPLGRYGRRSGGLGGSVMAVYDVNGDKLNDVVTSLNAHGFGLAWYEQKKDGSFTQHMIMDDYAAKNPGNVTFSELHGSTFADIDGDGITDFVVGKRYFSHVDTYLDPDPYGPAVVYWFRTVRDPKAPGGASFVPELVHNRSGAGSDLLVTDLDKNGTADIVTSTNRGTFIFWNKKK